MAFKVFIICIYIVLNTPYNYMNCIFEKDDLDAAPLFCILREFFIRGDRAASLRGGLSAVDLPLGLLRGLKPNPDAVDSSVSSKPNPDAVMLDSVYTDASCAWLRLLRALRPEARDISVTALELLRNGLSRIPWEICSCLVNVISLHRCISVMIAAAMLEEVLTTEVPPSLPSSGDHCQFPSALCHQLDPAQPYDFELFQLLFYLAT